MTREETKAAIAVMQAWMDGAEVERTVFDQSSDWMDAPMPSWDWSAFDYRVKLKPKKVTLQAWIDELGELRWLKPDNPVAFSDSWTRVPSEDKVVEIEE